MAGVNDLLDLLGRRLNTELMESIMDALPSMGLRPDARSFEMALNAHFTARNFVT